MNTFSNLGSKMAAFILLLSLIVCYTAAQAQEKVEYLDLAELLSQAKLAFLTASAKAPPAGEVRPKEIQLQLKGVTQKGAGAKTKFSFFGIGAGIKQENAHSITVTFEPVAEQALMTQGTTANALSDAILTVYFAIASASPEYKLKDGEIEIKCVLVKEGNANLVLTPLELNVDYKNELVQVIKIKF